MKYTFGDNAGGGDGRAGKIRELFVAGTTIAAHTEICIDKGLWSESELRAKAATICRAEVRRALKSLVDGMPFAGRTADQTEGAPIWKQRELWSQEDYALNCAMYRRDIAESAVAIHNKLASECREKFGSGPTLIMLSEADD